MIDSLREEFPTVILDFIEWHKEIKNLEEWKELYGEQPDALNEIPMFILFALFKKFFAKYNLCIDTEEYYKGDDKSLYSYTLKYKKRYDVMTEFSTDREAMIEVIIKACRILT